MTNASSIFANECVLGANESKSRHERIAPSIPDEKLRAFFCSLSISFVAERINAASHSYINDSVALC